MADDEAPWPLAVFARCPRCGSERGAARSIKQYACPACGFQYFQNAATAAIGVIRDVKGRVLFVRREKEPAAGKLDLPGGFVDPLETAEQAVAREVLEETGLRVEGVRYLTSFTNRYDYAGVTYYSCDLVFECRTDDPARAQSLDEVTGIAFIHPREVALEEIGFRSVRAVVRWLVERSSLLETEQ